MTTPIAALLSILTPITPVSIALPQDDDDDDEVFELSPFSVDSGGFSGYGATPGGAQDINYARAQIDIGNIPHPNTITAEGLFSEHDLPLSNRVRSDDLLCVNGEAMPAELLEMPDAIAIGQIGFESGIDPSTWSRDPVNLIAVVDKSGSMSGQPLDLVKKSLLQVVSQMGSNDQLSIVLYGDRSHVFLEPTPMSGINRRLARETIESIVSSGSTNMEAGLKVGYKVAESSGHSFEGITRLMLFTDERPNVGNTSPEGFMGLMEAGSLNGVGLTTIGVGVQFGAELANRVSSVRGGNLFYFPDRVSMVDKFENEFETMVTELAYDMKLQISPVSGYRISGVFGVPSEAFRWNEDKSITLEVETLFLSQRKGALYFALASDRGRNLPRRAIEYGSTIATVDLSFKKNGLIGKTRQSFDFKLSSRNQASLGLERGENLINQYLSMVAATEAHHKRNDQETAYQILRQISARLRSSGDADLEKEVEMISQLQNKLALLSGHRGESILKGIFSSPLVGNWLASPEDNESIDSETIMKIDSRGHFLLFTLDEGGDVTSIEKGLLRDRAGKKRKGTLALMSQREFESNRARKNPFPKAFETAIHTEIESFSYKLKGGELVVKFQRFGSGEPRKVVFKRARNAYSAIEPRRHVATAEFVCYAL